MRLYVHAFMHVCRSENCAVSVCLFVCLFGMEWDGIRFDV